jgi:hypothetical protein
MCLGFQELQLGVVCALYLLWWLSVDISDCDCGSVFFLGSLVVMLGGVQGGVRPIGGHVGREPHDPSFGKIIIASEDTGESTVVHDQHAVGHAEDFLPVATVEQHGCAPFGQPFHQFVHFCFAGDVNAVAWLVE